MFLFSTGAIERHGNLEAALDALLMDPPVTWNPIAAKKGDKVDQQSEMIHK